MPNTPTVLGRDEMRADDRGAAALEFALIVPVLLVFLYGIIQFGMIFLMQHGLTEAAADAARLAATAPQDNAAALATTEIAGYVNSDTGNLIGSACTTGTSPALSCTATVAQCAGQPAGFNCLTVKVVYNYDNDPHKVAPDLLGFFPNITESSTVLLSGSLS